MSHTRACPGTGTGVRNALLAACVCSALLHAQKAEAWECAGYDPIIVAPGTRQRVAPKNTMLFVDLAPEWFRYAAFRSNEASNAATGKVEAIELCRGTSEGAWNQETCEAVRVAWELTPAHENSRWQLLGTPKRELEAGAWYVVIAKTRVGPARLAEFAVSARTDDAAPRLAGVLEQWFGRRGGGMSGPRQSLLRLVATSVVDDTTRDDAVRFEVVDDGKPKGEAPLTSVFGRADSESRQGTVLDLIGDDECGPGNFTLPNEDHERAYRVRAVDLAGNASPEVLIERSKPEPREQGAKPAPVVLPPVYYVPKLGVFSKPTVYRGTGMLLSLALLLGVWIYWRRQQK